MTQAGPGRTSWPEALDALEEWVRRAAEGALAPDPVPPGSAPALPEGTLPGDLRLRAQQLVHALGQVEETVLRRRERLQREATYDGA